MSPDGLEILDPHTLVVGENRANQVSLVHLSGDPAGEHGTKQVIAKELQQPTTSAIWRGSAWTVISQQLAIDGPGAPSLPFVVERIVIPGIR